MSDKAVAQFDLWSQVSNQIQKFSFELINAFVQDVMDTSQNMLIAGNHVITGHLAYESGYSNITEISDKQVTITFGYDTKLNANYPIPPKVAPKPANYAMPVDYRTGFFSDALIYVGELYGTKVKSQLGLSPTIRRNVTLPSRAGVRSPAIYD